MVDDDYTDCSPSAAYFRNTFLPIPSTYATVLGLDALEFAVTWASYRQG
jgi:hypothetical protein